MHKVAISTTVAAVLFVLSTGGFTEISYRREINNDGPPYSFYYQQKFGDHTLKYLNQEKN